MRERLGRFYKTVVEREVWPKLWCIGYVKEWIKQPTKQIFYKCLWAKGRKGSRLTIELNDQVEVDLIRLNISNWKAKAKNRINWNRHLEQAKTPKG